MEDVKSWIDKLWNRHQNVAPLLPYDMGLFTGLTIAYLLQNPALPASERYNLKLFFNTEDNYPGAAEMYHLLNQLTRLGDGLEGLVRLQRIQSDARELLTKIREHYDQLLREADKETGEKILKTILEEK